VSTLPSVHISWCLIWSEYLYVLPGDLLTHIRYCSISLRSLYLWCDMSANKIFFLTR
jgi:hypothetical protein